MKKAIVRCIRHAVSRAKVELLDVRDDGKGHVRFRIRHGEREKNFTTSSTPTNYHYLANNIYHDIRRFIEGRYQ